LDYIKNIYENQIDLTLTTLLVLASSTFYQYQTTDDMSKFYADKLSCENFYTQGFNIWGNKVYGDIYK